MTGQNSTPSGAQQIRAMFDAVLAGDLAKLTRALHPDLVVIEPESLPYGGIYRGRDAFVGELLPKMLGPFELGQEDARIIDGGDTVVGQMVCVFTSRRSGKSLRMPYVEIYSFEDGLIRSINVFPQDTAALTDFMRREMA